MKKTNFLIVLFLSLASYIIFSSRSSGAGFNGLGDLTGSPVSGGTCANCHSGGNFGASVSIRLLDGSNNPVTSYTPGQSYVLEVDVNNSSGAPFGFGAQAVALTTTNANAGTMGTVITGNTRTVAISGRSYMEQSSVSANGLFKVNWTAPVSGTGNVIIYAVGNVVNGGSTSGDQITTNNLTITEAVPTTISYQTTSYCQTGFSPAPIVTGIQGGTFSSISLAINASTGIIDLANSVPGNHVVTYTYAGGSTTTNITINAPDQATVSYNANSFCTSSVAQNPVITGVQNGSFSAGSGLSINTTTGIINPSQSVPGNYTVSYTTNGNCPATATVNIIINAQDVASFNYGSNPLFCTSQSQLVTPTITGVQNGSFSSTVGLSLNNSTGEINPSASSAGVYNINYNTSGNCPANASTSITISNQDTVNLNYGTTPSFCNSVASVTANASGSAGTFTSSAGLNINGVSGEVFPVSSLAGSYTVTLISSGNCPDTATTNLTILQSDNADFSYNGGTFCTSGANAVPSALVTTGGLFSSSPAGLDIDINTGIITVVSSAVGSYSVTYITTSTTCPDTNTVNVQITNAGSAAFSYSQSNFCTGGPNQLPVISGLGGGQFSAAPTGLSISSTDGSILVGNSLAGTYTVYYNVAGSCPASDSTQVTVNETDFAEISFNGNNSIIYFSSSLGDSVYQFGCSTTVPIVNGANGGTFSTNSNLIIDPNSGIISSQHFPPTLFYYTTNGICPTTDSFYVESLCPVGLENVQFNSHISIYPNPSFDGNFRIKNSNETCSAVIEIYNHLGQKIEIRQMALQNGVEQVLNISDKNTTGFYIVKIKTLKGEQTFKLFKE